MRAISGIEELAVSFGKGKAYIQGNRARVPMPDHLLQQEQLASLRGIADKFALRARFHDEDFHRRQKPITGIARDIFESVEEARIEAIGSRLMQGVADNRDANLEEQCRSFGYDRLEDASQAPLGEAVGFLVREKLTGTPVPPTAAMLLDYWRDHIEECIGDELDHLDEAIYDQREFVRLTRRLLSGLGLGDEWREELLDQEADEQD